MQNACSAAIQREESSDWIQRLVICMFVVLTALACMPGIAMAATSETDDTKALKVVDGESTYYCDTFSDIIIQSSKVQITLQKDLVDPGQLAGEGRYAACTFTTNPTVDIDLNGHEISNSGSTWTFSIYGNNITATIHDGTMKNDTSPNTGVFATNGSHTNVNITFENVTITNPQEGSVGMYLPADGTYKLDGCTVEAMDEGVEIRAGSLTVVDTTITGGSSSASSGGNDNGTTSSGTALAIAQHTTKKAITVTVKGDSVISGNTASVMQSDPQGNGMLEDAPVTVILEAGTFTGELTADLSTCTFEVKGGTYDTDPTDYVVSGSVINAMEDGTFVVNQATVEGGDITVGEADVEDGASEVMVAVDKATVQAAKEAGSLKLATPSSSMTLDSKALEQILAAAGDDSVVTIDYATAEKVDAAVAKDITATYKKTALLTLEATVYVDGVEQPLYGSSITLSMPHDSFAQAPTAVYYVNNNGDIEGIYKVTDDGEGYAFTTTHLSTYVYAGEQAARVTMYRLYNPNSGEHFYTAELEERDALIAEGWKGEGIGWIAPSVSSTPVYRLYSGTDHHYTTSATERDYLVSVGWTDEGIGWYSDDSESVALYRQYNPFVDPSAKTNNSGSHNYTTSTDERDNLVSLGWIDEDVAWYGML